MFDDSQYYNWAGPYQAVPANAPQPTVATYPTDRLPVVFRPVGQGQVVAFASEQPFPGEVAMWSWLFRSLDPGHWMWYQRNGLSLRRENRDFWNLLIPGVGRAPVNAFLLLITLFVVTIGPVNYFFLRRKGRLYLLLITIPAGALLVTVGLLCFALLTDGVRVRARVRGLTEIDQRTQRAVAWSRQSYYAGLSPAAGLEFPSDAAVYPLYFRPSAELRGNSSRRIAWHDQQHFSGYLPSRTSTQFLVVESRSTTRQVVVTSAGTGVPTRIRNELGVGMVRVVVRGADDRMYAAGPLADGAESDLQPMQPDEQAAYWNRRLSLSSPEYPTGFDPSDLENAWSFFDFGPSFYNGTADQSLAPPSIAQGLGERRLRRWLAGNFAGLPPQSYLALVEGPVEVSLGYRGSRTEASLYVVQGRW
jgi:hypothetical protein